MNTDSGKPSIGFSVEICESVDEITQAGVFDNLLRSGYGDEKIATSHFGWLRKAEQEKQRRGYVRQDAIAHPETLRVSRDVDELDEIRCVGCVRGTVRVAHLLTVAMVRSDQTLAP